MVTVQAVAFQDESLRIHNRKNVSYPAALHRYIFGFEHRDSHHWVDEGSRPKNVPVSFESPLDAVIDQPCRASWITIQFCSHKVEERSICWRSSFPAAGIEDKTSMSWKMSQQLIVPGDGVVHKKQRCGGHSKRLFWHTLCDVRAKGTKGPEFFQPLKKVVKSRALQQLLVVNLQPFPIVLKKNIANTGDEGLPIDGQHKFQNVLCGSNQPSSGWLLPLHSYAFGEKM